MSLHLPSIDSKQSSASITARSYIDDAPYSSIQTKTKSMITQVESNNKTHSFQGEMAFRDERPLVHSSSRHAYGASQLILATAGPSTKASQLERINQNTTCKVCVYDICLLTKTFFFFHQTSLKYAYAKDTRDSIESPSQGGFHMIIYNNSLW